MSELPSGTVTLLFTDIEGSTTLVRELGDAWPDALDQYRKICRETWAEFDGHELGTEGDSFFVVFATAGDAVYAAHRVQLGLASADWPMPKPIRARIGIHSGSPKRHADGYVGMDVHRAARVAGAAHGGQVVMSETTKHLAAATLHSGLGLLNLGEHQLKDIPERMRLFQLTGADLVREFPALKSRGAAGSLPGLLTPTVGRDGELAELRDLLVVDHARLITLTGPGGSGKTRLATTLARQVADEFHDGVFLVELESATRPTEVWSGIAQVLDVPADGHVPPGFFDYVGDKYVLLVLDNLEQITGAEDVVRELLRVAQHITVVATSRRPLHVEGEYEHAVPPLLLPAGPSYDEIAESGAVKMFLEHAPRVRRGFCLTEENAKDIAAVCIAVDGLPLAIELAAARVKMLTPSAILTRIDQALDLSSADRSRPSRQRTLRGAIEWSYDLLEAPHQHVLNHLGVFEGGATIDALDAVVPPELIDGQDLLDILYDLLDASLARTTDGQTGEPRFTLLETIKRFALDQLIQQEHLETAYIAHAQHFYDEAKHLTASLDSSRYATVRARLLEDLNNYRTLIDRGAVGVQEPTGQAVVVVPPAHVVRQLAEIADDFGLMSDAATWCVRGLELADPEVDPVGYAWLVVLRERFSRFWGVDPDAPTRLGSALQLVRTAGALTDPLTGDDALDVECALVTAIGMAHLDSNAQAGRLAVEEALKLSVGRSPLVRSRALELAYLYGYLMGDFEASYTYLQESGTLLEAAGSPRFLLMWQNNMADLEMMLGQYVTGQARLGGAVEPLIECGSPIAVITAAETFAAIIGREHPLLCARVFGAAETAHAVEASPIDPLGATINAQTIATIRAPIEPAAWDAAWERGRGENVVDLLREMAELPLGEDDENPRRS